MAITWQDGRVGGERRDPGRPWHRKHGSGWSPFRRAFAGVDGRAPFAARATVRACPAMEGVRRRTGKGMTMKALVCGAGGFIGGHLVSTLKNEGYWVRGVDAKLPEHRETAADEFLLLDLRSPRDCAAAVSVPTGGSTRCTSWRPTWAAWGSSPPPRRTSCGTNVLINVHMITAAI